MRIVLIATKILTTVFVLKCRKNMEKTESGFKLKTNKQILLNETKNNENKRKRLLKI
jgi:hypothetical protein